MTSMFHEIRRTVETTASRSSFPITRILSILGISRAWYYRHLDLPPIIDKRFNPFEISDEELRVIKYRYQHKKMSFRLLAYSMIEITTPLTLGGLQDTEEIRPYNTLGEEDMALLQT